MERSPRPELHRVLLLTRQAHRWECFAGERDGDVGSCTRNSTLPRSRDPVSPRPQVRPGLKKEGGGLAPHAPRGGTTRVPGASGSLVRFTFRAERRPPSAPCAREGPPGSRTPFSSFADSRLTPWLADPVWTTDGGGLAPHPPSGGRTP